MKVLCDGQLVNLIQTAQNEQFKMLDKDLLKSSIEWETLLHHAAFYNNEVIARHLIDVGLNVDALDSDGRTPLMVAVEVRSVAVTKVLLQANASIDITDVDGKSALRMVFHPDYFSTKILEPILQRLRRDCSDIEVLVDRLIEAGCSMYHASYLRDIRVMEMLLERNIDIDSRGYCKRAALHAAVATSDLDMANWILNKGGCVDALDEYGKSALFDAATNGKVDLMHLLLERGANPNTRHANTEYTPLFAVFAFSLDESDQGNFDACTELLLRYGAIPENSSVDHNTLFDYALLNPAENNKVDYLIGQLAILHKLGKVNAKSVLRCNIEEHGHIVLELRNIYESCNKLLELIVYGDLSLFDLLTENQNKMRTLVRNRMIMSEIDFICSKLSEIYPYYCRILKERISKATDMVMLEDATIPVFSKLFNANYNLCYNFARLVTGYLSERDLERLCQV
ncbi:ankyrin repeat domain-containing protein 50-like [Phymastichus coffea]|uniref:ankyrin repeat domain-containing protein 50-like n=1 Tax=Phymastichus coffea TaxID=108790 RepID=UPI00273CA822|nr:ankyrin repeat domain-containing protein 50-like [Phymastichus coffea]XP_058802580.1 ankyrin repeat domain-containing protein 50-like [Phymastichus coffea]